MDNARVLQLQETSQDLLSHRLYLTLALLEASALDPSIKIDVQYFKDDCKVTSEIERVLYLDHFAFLPPGFDVDTNSLKVL